MTERELLLHAQRIAKVTNNPAEWYYGCIVNLVLVRDGLRPACIIEVPLPELTKQFKLHTCKSVHGILCSRTRIKKPRIGKCTTMKHEIELGNMLGFPCSGDHLDYRSTRFECNILTEAQTGVIGFISATGKGLRWMEKQFPIIRDHIQRVLGIKLLLHFECRC